MSSISSPHPQRAARRSPKLSLELRPSKKNPWALYIQPKVLESSVKNLMERTLSVWSDCNIWDHLCKWSFLTDHSFRTLPIWQNYCLQYCSSVSCLKYNNQANARWVGSGLCNLNVPFHWTRVDHYDHYRLKCHKFVTYKHMVKSETGKRAV